MATTGIVASPWHQGPGVLARYVTDLVWDELVHLRPGSARLPERPWPAGLLLDEQGLGLDSLERLSVASAVTEALHLHESGLEDLLLARRRFGDWLQVAADGLSVFDARLTFRTSGSSGAAKACTHALVDLLQEVDVLAAQMADRRRVLTAVPSHHIYGFLFTALLPHRLGCRDVIDVRQMTPQALASLMQPGDLVVSHPAHWALLARHAGQLPPGVQGVTSTAPCPDALALRLAALGLQTLTQVYGSSETAGIGTRTLPSAPFTLLPFWSRDAGDDQRLLRTGVDGSSTLHALQDHVAWHDAHRFSVCGRRDDAVQVGGTNVFPARVRQVLLDHPQVADAAVRLMAPEEGARLKAFVVGAPGCDLQALPSALWAWTESRLTAPERPKAFTLGTQLPRNAMGKLADWPLDVPDRGHARAPVQ